MQHVKKLVSSLLALAMVAAFCLTAFADDAAPYTVTIESTATGHTYEAYQVFTGTLSGSTLSDIQWGSSVDSAALLTALKADATLGTTFAACSTAADVAALLSDSNAAAFAQIAGQHLTTAAGTSTAATGGYAITGLAAGYYLVKDKDGTQDQTSDAYTSFILKVVQNTSAAPKSGTPTVSKKVKENTKYTKDEGYGTGYNDVADYNIGDTIPFELIGTLPTNYSSYTTYSYAFHDTASAGLTIDKSSVKVLAGTTDITASFTVALDGQNLTVSCDNLKAITALTAGSEITVQYNATLNANAVVGLSGNPNEVYLTYSNNPNQGGTGNTGKTPTDKVIVFTYELDTTKVDGKDATKKLSGAEFQLYKMDGTSKSYAIVSSGKVTGWTTDSTKATTLTSDENGLFKVAGLDAGEYFLHESKAPAGYNTLSDDVKLTIAATTANGQTWTSGDAAKALTALNLTSGGKTAAGDTATGTVSLNVENNVGSTLPSTGGIGTTVFTVSGIALILIAGVLYTVRRKVGRGE
jgi:fimbrial isopeptide formation D2 family protein/LPXTG-motif cell wall-anchored protein